ncbi:MAG: hypothetical protein R3F59_32170 [Myxococcota bacterium]
MSFVVHQFNYQVLQAYDFLELHRRHGCQLQIGGDDQWATSWPASISMRRITGARV